MNGRYRLALKTSKQLITERPNNSEAVIYYAWALLENGQPSKAMEFANLAVELHGNTIRSHLGRGYILMRLGILEGAITDLDRTIEEQKGLLGLAYLNKARSLAGLGRFKEAKLSVKLCMLMNNNQESDFISKVYDKAEEVEKKKKNLSKTEVTELLDMANKSLREKESWFSLFVSKIVLASQSLEAFHEEAHLIELEAMLHTHQFKPAFAKAETLKGMFKKNKRFDQIYSALEKMTKEENARDEEKPKPDIPKPILRFTQENVVRKTLHDENDVPKKKKYSASYFPNDNVEVFSAKLYDLADFHKSNEKIFLEQFDIKKTNEICAEIIFSNPNFRVHNKTFDCQAVWYLNDFQVYKNDFVLKVNKDWDSVIFTQQCGAEEDHRWSLGQCKIEIYIEKFKVCEKWFFVDNNEIPVLTEPLPKQEEKFDEKIEQEILQSDEALTDKDETITPARPIEELIAELDTFIGLGSIKKSIRDFVDYLKFQKERENLGLKSEDGLQINAVFVGNPGTGKTTIARLLGEIFKSMGIIPKGHVVEVDRAALVGQYIGETAQKTDKIIEDAMGGVLFIDEAYTLVKSKGGGQDFGQEAIDILLKRMEDRKGKFVVIAAGYPEEMETFLTSNPGMKSRFNHTFIFEDYTPDELIEIFTSLLNKSDYVINDGAKGLLKKELIRMYRKRDKTFGNGRLSRQLFEKIKLALSKRLIGMPEEERTKDAMRTIIESDVEEVIKPESGKSVILPIDEEALNESLNDLNKLIGLESVKNEIRDLVKLVRYFIEQSEDVKEKFSSHVLFLGNPGTGKTTAARILARIYSALSILPKGHVVEADRQALVASHVGGTAEKTKSLIAQAMGGTLFIDEAYTLTVKDNPNDFGKEAIDTLLKLMEDERGKFIVIAAGYTEEMKNFIESNPGMQSRFTKTFMFEDYNPSELIEISRRLLSSQKLLIDKDAENELLRHFNEIYRSRDKNFGNARIVRSIFEKAIQKRLLRLADLPAEERDGEESKKILLEDIEYGIGKKVIKKPYEVKGDPQKLEKLMEELQTLTGLNSVKSNVEKLISGLKVAKMRKDRGLKVIEKNLHSVFVGNPGTGKTTVARLMSRIYKELGLIEKGHLVEVDRSSLVAGYQGQTAIKTDKIIERSLGGTLFIDEAYTLSRGKNDFGQEAIDTLLKRMEDYRGQFIVIAAGYTDEMKNFLESNPGLSSRFTNFFHFEDYESRQLLEIAVNIADQSGYKLDEGALQLFLEVFDTLYTKRDKNFGNARTAKNILYKAISYQEERITTLYDYNDEDLMTIIYEDVAKIKLEDF